MKTQELRAEARVEVRQRGTLNAGEEWFPCLIQDMSSIGFLLMCSRDLAIGQTLEFKCHLFPDKLLTCKLEVVHLTDGGVGTKIIDIEPRGANLCQLFLQEQYSDRLNKSG
jgi:hypothetical protein